MSYLKKQVSGDEGRGFSAGFGFVSGSGYGISYRDNYGSGFNFGYGYGDGDGNDFGYGCGIVTGKLEELQLSWLFVLEHPPKQFHQPHFHL